MAIPKPGNDEKFSYADYLSWPHEERWELIEGIPYDMSPAPSPLHQEVLVEMSRQLGNYLVGKPCRVYVAPFDVRLSENASSADDETFTVVQPDIVVVCDRNKIDERGCKGAPDLCVEILSPATAYKDMGKKLELYRSHGVREYWIVNPESRSVMVYLHENGTYSKPVSYNFNEVLVSTAIEGLLVELRYVFRISGN